MAGFDQAGDVEVGVTFGREGGAGGDVVPEGEVVLEETGVSGGDLVGEVGVDVGWLRDLTVCIVGDEKIGEGVKFWADGRRNVFEWFELLGVSGRENSCGWWNYIPHGILTCSL